MQKQETFSFEIGHLLNELTMCINDLHKVYDHFSSTDLQLAEQNLARLNALIRPGNKRLNPVV